MTVCVTCVNSWGTDLDLVLDCTSKCCVDGLKRFNSRRAPKIVISDNGKHFISTDVQNFETSSAIYWKFNIESAAWYRSFFECSVKSVKRCLKKQLGKERIDYDETTTVLKESENVLNNKFISYTYFESDLIESITLNKLLCGRNLEVTKSNGRFKSYKTRPIPTNVIKAFLVQIHIWIFNWPTWALILPKVNDVKLIKDDNYKRLDWKVGRVTELICSKDNQVRAAKVNIVIKRSY